MSVLRMALPKQETKNGMTVQKEAKLVNPMLEIFAKAGGSIVLSDLPNRGLMQFADSEFGQDNIEIIYTSSSRDGFAYVRDGIADLCLIGGEKANEQLSTDNKEQSSPRLFQRFNEVAKCKMCLAAPAEQAALYAETPAAMNGASFVTSYPGLLRNYLEEIGVTPGRIVAVSGQVEDARSLYNADIIMDMVQTGGTLKKFGLAAFTDIFESSAELYRAAQPLSADKEAALARLTQRLAQKTDAPVKNEETPGAQPITLAAQALTL